MSIEDVAQEVEAAEWAARNIGRPVPAKYKPGDEKYGPEECECGAEMPTLRREDGRLLCTSCQSAVERRSKLGIRPGAIDPS